MPGTFLASLLPQSGTLLLLCAAILSLGGATLIGYAAWMRREALERRVNLILPRQVAAAQGVAPPLSRTTVAPAGGGLAIQDRREIIRRLAAIRVPAAHAMTVFTLMRGASVVACAIAVYALASIVPALAAQSLILLLAALGGGIGGWFLPVLAIERVVKGRMAAVARGLPDALELLVVCVEAGLSLDDGLDRIVVEMHHAHPALAEELALTAADLKILPSRDQALANLARRVDMPSVRSVVTTLSQTMRYGTPLAQALRRVASEMRNDALLELEERANRLPTLLTLPMMLFIMPTIFLIVGGPAALRLIDTFPR